MGQSLSEKDQAIRDPFASVLAPQPSENVPQSDRSLSNSDDSSTEKLPVTARLKQLIEPVAIQKTQKEKKVLPDQISNERSSRKTISRKKSPTKVRKKKAKEPKPVLHKEKSIHNQISLKKNSLPTLVGVVHTAQGGFAIIEHAEKRHIVSEGGYWGNKKVLMIQQKTVVFQHGKKQVILNLQGK